MDKANESSSANRRTFHFQSDQPITSSSEDRLDYAPYADALAELIGSRDTPTPLVAAISGQWGSGKTTLAHLIEERLNIGSDWERPHAVCWFNAWAHDDAPHLGAAFAAHVGRTVNRYRPWWQRLISPLPSAMLSPMQRWYRLVWTVIILAACAIVGVLGPGIRPALGVLVGIDSRSWSARAMSGLRDPASMVVVGLLVVWVTGRIFTALRSVGKFIDSPRSEAARGAMAEVSVQLGILIGKALRGKRRLIIFVDDLDRCRSPRSLEVCEICQQLLGHRDVVTVLIADMESITDSAIKKYAPESGLSNDNRKLFGVRYLQKLVHIQFTLPEVSRHRMHFLFDRLNSSNAPAIPDGHAEVRIKMQWRSVLIHAGLVGMIGLGLVLSILSLLTVNSSSTRQDAGGEVADSVRGFVAPVVALLIGSFSLRYVIPSFVLRNKEGAEKERIASVAFISYLLLGILVYMLIEYGALILYWLGSGLSTLSDGHGNWHFSMDSTQMSWVALILLAVGITGLSIKSQNARHQRMHKALDVEIAKAVAASSDIEVIVKRVSNTTIGQATGTQDIRRRVVRLIASIAEKNVSIRADDGDVEGDASRVTLAMLPETPRSMKRLLNEIRLSLIISYERRMIFPDAPIRPEHVSKWVVLSHYWPLLAQWLKGYTEQMGRLEAVNSVDDLHRILSGVDIDIEATSTLVYFLRNGPMLASVLSNLVRFEPV